MSSPITIGTLIGWRKAGGYSLLGRVVHMHLDEAWVELARPAKRNSAELPGRRYHTTVKLAEVMPLQLEDP